MWIEVLNRYVNLSIYNSVSIYTFKNKVDQFAVEIEFKTITGIKDIFVLGSYETKETAEKMARKYRVNFENIVGVEKI